MPDPAFSVVVPTYRRPRQLADCLEALARLESPEGGFEAVVVSDDESAELLPTREPEAGSFPVRFLRQPHAGPSVARNTGAAEARGRFLAFTDDDCAPAPDWLAKLEAAFGQTQADAVGGRTLNALPRNLCSEASQLLLLYVYRYYNANPLAATFFATNNLAVRAETFRSVGGFDPSFGLAGGEDRDLCDRLLHAGSRLVYCRDAVVSHAHALSLPGFWKQHDWYGRGAYRFRRARAARQQEPVEIEPLGFYRDLLQTPFGEHSGLEAVALAALMGLSQLANAVGFFRERWTMQRASFDT